MTLSLAKSTWSLRERLLYTDLNLLAVELLKAVDGNAGGTISPSAKISVQGSQGLEIAGTGSAARLRYASRNVARVIPAPVANRNANWLLSDAPLTCWWAHNTTTAGQRLWWPLTGLPNGATLSSVELSCIGTTGGTLPATMPQYKVIKQDKDSTTQTDVFAFYADTSASNAAYTVDHKITKTGLSHTIDTEGSQYMLVVESPGGGGTTAGFTVYGIQVTCAVTDQSEYNP